MVRSMQVNSLKPHGRRVSGPRIASGWM